MFGKKKDVQPAGEKLGGLSDQLARAQASMARAEGQAGDEKAGMSLAELDRFIHGALSEGAGDQTRVMVRVNITGGIKRIWTRDEKSVD